MARRSKREEELARQVLIQPFDIAMWSTKDGQGLYRLQERFALWLRTLAYPSRFICWQMPADLRGRIAYVADLARQEDDLVRKRLIMESRRFYEQLQNGAQYQRSLCGMGFWTDETVTAHALAGTVGGVLNTPAIPAPWPRLFDGSYILNEPQKDFKHWHLRPYGHSGGRYYFAFLSSYEFLPVNWFFDRPLKELMGMSYPLAICLDIPNTYERSEAIQKVEGVKMATEVHLVTGSGEDSRSKKKYQDCEQTLQALNAGDLLHEIQLIIAVAAPDRSGLKKAVDEVLNRMKPYVKMRLDPGEGQLEAAKFFSAIPSRKISLPRSSWSMISQDAAMLLGPLGYRKLAGMEGTMRGQSLDGRYPFFFHSWEPEKKATHEVWVGQTGSGKVRRTTA